MRQVTGILIALVFFTTAGAQVADSTAGAEYAASFATQKGVKQTPGGVLYKILKKGKGKPATILDSVAVEYEGRLITGEVFDRTRSGFHRKFPMNILIPGWIEVLSFMKEGAKVTLLIPPAMGYGETGMTRNHGVVMVPPDAYLEYDIYLVKVIRPQ